MTSLYLLRHGIAVQRGSAKYPKDAERPLTKEGRDKLRRISRAMEAMQLQFDLILASPYKRARQTGEIVADRFKARDRLRLSENLAADGDPKRLLAELQSLRPRPESVLLVGHEPYLSELAAWLLTDETGLRLVLKKGGLCKLAIQELKPARCAVLEWLLTPHQMGLLT